MLAKERHPLRTQGCRLRFYNRTAVRARRENGMMKEERDVWKATAIERLQLGLHPGELHGVVGNSRVERNEKSVAIAECVGRVSVQAPRRTVRRNKAGVRREV